MVTKQQIHAEVDRLPDEDLDAVYRSLVAMQQTKERVPTLLQKLRQINIEAPADFSLNYDTYLRESERGDGDVR